MFETTAVARAVEELRSAASAVVREDRSAASLDDWVGLVAGVQELSNRLSAVQALGLAALSATESVMAEDRTLVERIRPVGHVRLDAAGLVSDVLGVSDARGAVLVEQAATLVSRLPRVTEALGAGRLDQFRAGVVADELAGVPEEVCRAVDDALSPHLGTEPPAALRRRVRRVLAAVDPDLLRERVERARRDRGLRRWVGQEPGVDVWEARFPSERSAQAWAAVDALARRYRAEGRCESVEQGRADALLDLVEGRATVSVGVQVTVPAAAAVVGAGHPGEGGEQRPGAGGVDRPGEGGGPGAGDDRPGVAAERGPTAGDDDSRSAVGFDARTTTGVTAAQSAAPASSAAGRLRMTSPLPGDQVVEAWVLGRVETMHVPRSWLEQAVQAARGQYRALGGGATQQPDVLPCHPATGGLMRHGAPEPREGYRPGAALVAFVKARDARCRFPGCVIAARFCDVDHVRPWPTGPTSADNLMCLCRRHHRVKQSPGWRVRLDPDGTVTWLDPVGREHRTAPVDLLGVTTAPSAAQRVGEGGSPGHGRASPSDDRGRTDAVRADRCDEEQPFSLLEHPLEHVLDRRRSHRPGRLGVGVGFDFQPDREPPRPRGPDVLHLGAAGGEPRVTQRYRRRRHHGRRRHRGATDSIASSGVLGDDPPPF